MGKCTSRYLFSYGGLVWVWEGEFQIFGGSKATSCSCSVSCKAREKFKDSRNRVSTLSLRFKITRSKRFQFLDFLQNSKISAYKLQMHLLSFVCLFDSQAFVILSTFILFAYEHVRLGTKSLGFKMGRSPLSQIPRDIRSTRFSSNKYGSEWASGTKSNRKGNPATRYSRFNSCIVNFRIISPVGKLFEKCSNCNIFRRCCMVDLILSIGHCKLLK